LLATAILVVAARRADRHREADQLVEELEDFARALVRLLGGDHPKSVSALVTLASAEFESAKAADDRERMERAADVIAIAAQRMSATLGIHHPRSLSALRSLATVEYEVVQALGARRGLHGARALVAAVARRAAVWQRAVPPAAEPSAPHAVVEPVARVPEQVEGQGDAVRFSVLGPLRAWRGEEPISTGSPQQRALLAVLLLRGGRTATTAELIDALWGEEPPSQALAAVRAYASRLRKVLAPGVLVSEFGGYAVRGVGVGALDLAVAEELAKEAEKARGAGDLFHARDALRRALALWDGETLAGVPGPYAEVQRVRLEEWRLQLLESRLSMDLEQNLHAEAVPELTALTAAHPLRERLRELLMLALYRGGRRDEAIAVYADTRKLLAELGVDPHPGLRELQTRILRADADLTKPPTTAPEPPVAPTRPAQLPSTISDFTGRASLVDELSEILKSAEGRVMAVSALPGFGGQGGITGIDGAGGVGKTTLAVRVAHRVRSSFPDGQLYLDLRGADSPTVEPETVLGAFLQALGVAESAIPDSLAERAALYRSTLGGRKVLVLLDNAKDAAQVRPLLPASDGCAALVTSRGKMADLAGAYLVDLDVMSSDEALSLFTKIVGEERVASERETAVDVVAACGFLPLAIRIVASRLAARRTWTVSVLAAELANERHRLDVHRADDLAVKATFELGYGGLEPAQARAFRLLGSADGPDISLAAAAAVLDLPREEAENLLESLVDTALLESAAPGRYRFHDLVRLYSRACAERDENPPSEREAALSRLLDFYLSTASGVYRIERPGDRLVDHLERTNHPGLTFENQDEAQDWLRSEAACLLASVRQAARPGTLRRAVDTLRAAVDLAESGADHKEYEAVAVVLRRAAQEAADPRSEARALTALAFVKHVSGRFDEGLREARRAIELAEAADDMLTSCWASSISGVVALYQNRHDEGEAHFARAIENYRVLGDHPGEASALCNLSRIHLATGRTASAVALARQGTALYDDMGHALKGANGRYALGLALTQSGQLSEAGECLRQALHVFRDSRQRLWEGMTRFRLAEVDIAARRPVQAAANAEMALTLLRGIGGVWRRGNILEILGRALDGIGQPNRAQVCRREALDIFEALGASDAADILRASDVDDVRSLLRLASVA
jgi:DNA-binding SARP family transcriptional activator